MNKYFFYIKQKTNLELRTFKLELLTRTSVSCKFVLNLYHKKTFRTLKVILLALLVFRNQKYFFDSSKPSACPLPLRPFSLAR